MATNAARLGKQSAWKVRTSTALAGAEAIATVRKTRPIPAAR